MSLLGQVPVIVGRDDLERVMDIVADIDFQDESRHPDLDQVFLRMCRALAKEGSIVRFPYNGAKSAAEWAKYLESR